MNSVKKLIVFLLIFYLCLVECQVLFGQYRFDVWTTDNGLPQNGLREITQTPDGYLWFTTFDGLVRFDGVCFTTFGKGKTKGIINNRFTGLYGDKDGTLYATTMEDGTLTIYRNGVFSSYTSEQVPGHYIQSIKSGEDGELRFLVEDEERKSKSWYYLREGKFVFSEKQDNTNVRVKYQGKSGRLWTITLDKTIESHNGNITVYPHRIQNLDIAVAAFEDSEGGLWLGGITLARLKDGKVQNFGEKEGFPINSDFHSFWEEADGSVWFANGGRSGPGVGLVRYKDGRFSFLGKESGLSDTSVFDVFKDREGTIWLATNKGLNRLRKKVIAAYSVQDGLIGSEVYPIYRDSKDDVWIGTTKGLSVYRNGKFETVNLKQTRRSVPEKARWKNGQMLVQSLWEDSNGRLWIGLNGGIFIARNGEVEMLKEAEGHHVFAIRQDKSGNVWAATNRGILLFKNYKLASIYSVKDGLPNEFMTLIYEDSHGRLWFGGYGGLSEFKDGKFINYTTKNGLTGNYVRSIYEDKEGTFWVGTYDEGLSRFKDGRFVNYKIEDGLYANGVFAIQEDSRGNFWISSNSGIYRVKRQELDDFANGKIAKINSVGYGKEDGMLNNECNGGRQPASMKDRDGKFWFPTQDGVVVVDSESENSNVLPPSVAIESATVEREQVDFRNGIIVEPGQRNIEINFTGISLIKSKQIKFKYKLEGHDSDWVDAGTRRTAYYSYLPPGNYKFRVIAANSEGIWNENGIIIDLQMKPFFYQTRLFYFICILGAALALFVIWKISVYQLESRERRLTKLVAERTEELRKANEELQQLANSDRLTGVGNRRRFEDFLADEWNRAVRFRTEISLILIDVDYFKLFNDTYGHQAGDECLKKIAVALAATVKRPTDLVARFGGEEFAIILGGTNSEGALNIAKQAMENVKNLKMPHGKSDISDYVTISIGVVAIHPKLGMTEYDLINAADKALYKAKENGRNQIISNDFLIQTPQNSFAMEEKYASIS
jgi:diguanylate cyclase (GGDEF)-like protein